MSSWVNSKNLLLGVHHVLVHILGIAYVDVSQCLSVVIGHTQSCAYVVEVDGQFFVQVASVLFRLVNGLVVLRSWNIFINYDLCRFLITF